MEGPPGRGPGGRAGPGRFPVRVAPCPLFPRPLSPRASVFSVGPSAVPCPSIRPPTPPSVSTCRSAKAATANC